MKHARTKFFLLLSLLTLNAQAKNHLRLGDVANSIEKHFPKIIAQDLQITQTEQNLRAQQGAFDVVANSKGQVTRGYYDNQVIDAHLKQYLGVLGSEVSAGYRQSEGTLATYDQEFETRSSGEMYGAIKVPLLQNSLMDEKRTKISVAKDQINEQTAKRLDLLAQIKSYGALTYWDWTSYRLKALTYQDMLAIALARQVAIRTKILAGEMPDIADADNGVAIQERRRQLILANRDLENAARKLSLFYRSPQGSPLIATNNMAPSAFPSTQKIPNEKQKQFWIDSHPKLQKISAKISQIEKKIRLGKNQILPKLDVGFKISKDYGTGPKSLGQPDVKGGMEFSFPLQNRKASAELQIQKLELQKLLQKKRFLRDDIQIKINNALELISAAQKSIAAANAEVAYAQRLAEAEREKFTSGDSNLLTVNIREQNAAKAILSRIDAYKDYFVGEALLHAATGGAYTLE